jgi:HSP20 family molecular chaperone IbpA
MNIQVTKRPRNLFYFDNLFDSTVDVFDPFDAFDQLLCRSDVTWLRRPVFSERSKKPIAPFKYRYIIDVHNYKPESIHVEINDNNLKVSGFGETKESDKMEESSRSEFRDQLSLPEDLNKDEMVSFMTKRGQLIVEIPFQAGLLRKYEVDLNDNGESGEFSYRLDMQESELENLKLFIKDYDLIISLEETSQLNEVQFFRIITLRLPETVNLDSIYSVYDGNALKIFGLLKQEKKVVKVLVHSVLEPFRGLLHIPQEHMTEVKVMPRKEEKPPEKILFKATPELATPDSESDLEPVATSFSSSKSKVKDIVKKLEVQAEKKNVDIDAIRVIPPNVKKFSNKLKTEKQLPDFIDSPSVIDLED